MHKTKGVSPKVLADLFASVGMFLLTALGAGLDPVTAAVISKAIGTLAGVIAGPGKVVPK